MCVQCFQKTNRAAKNVSMLDTKSERTSKCFHLQSIYMYPVSLLFDSLPKIDGTYEISIKKIQQHFSPRFVTSKNEKLFIRYDNHFSLFLRSLFHATHNSLYWHYCQFKNIKLFFSRDKKFIVDFSCLHSSAFYILCHIYLCDFAALLSFFFPSLSFPQFYFPFMCAR